MSQRFGLEAVTIAKICAVFARYPQVEKAVIFGSRAKGNYKPGSDIDLSLYGDAGLTREVLYQIMAEIDDLRKIFNGTAYIHASGEKPMGMPSMPTLLTIAPPNGLAARPSKGMPVA